MFDDYHLFLPSFWDNYHQIFWCPWLHGANTFELNQQSAYKQCSEPKSWTHKVFLFSWKKKATDFKTKWISPWNQWFFGWSLLYYFVLKSLRREWANYVIFISKRVFHKNSLCFLLTMRHFEDVFYWQRACDCTCYQNSVRTMSRTNIFFSTNEHEWNNTQKWQITSKL